MSSERACNIIYFVQWTCNRCSVRKKPELIAASHRVAPRFFIEQKHEPLADNDEIYLRSASMRWEHLVADHRPIIRKLGEDGRGALFTFGRKFASIDHLGHE